MWFSSFTVSAGLRVEVLRTFPVNWATYFWRGSGGNNVFPLLCFRLCVRSVRILSDGHYGSKEIVKCQTPRKHLFFFNVRAWFYASWLWLISFSVSCSFLSRSHFFSSLFFPFPGLTLLNFHFTPIPFKVSLISLSFLNFFSLLLTVSYQSFS